MTAPHVTAVSRTQGNNAALKSGEVTPHSVRLDFQEVPVLVDAFRRMVRGQEFDVCEMALTTYLVAREHGVPITAVPAFLVRGFHHGAITIDTRHGITSPKDLEGTRVGVSRGYTVTTGVWARAVLATEHGVDLDSITWVLSGDEHVSAYRPPANVESKPAGRQLDEMLASGDLAAVVGMEIDSPDAAPLIPDPVEAGFAALQQRGLYPINHLVVIRNELLAAQPELGVDVFDAFARAKQDYVRRLRDGAIEAPSKTDQMYARVMELTGTDPLPYGIEPNRHVLETLMRTAVDQHILTRPRPLEELFAAGTEHVVA